MTFTFKNRVPAGFGLMIWQLDKCGGVAGVIAKAKQHGLDGIMLKGADGDSQWTNQFTRAIVDAFHAADVSVIGWHYVYGGPGNGAPAWSSVAGEIAAATYILSCGADGYLFDDEVELDGKAAVVIEYGKALRRAYPEASIGYNPYPYPSSDVSQPFFEFNQFCDYCMPQLYVGQDGFGTPAAAIAKMEADFAHWSPLWAARPGGRAAIPLCIDWQGASWPGAVQPDSFITDAARVSLGKVPLITYWDMDSLTPGEWAAVGQASTIFHGGTGGTAVGIPTGWSDSASGQMDVTSAVLKAPNGIPVVHGFRDWVLSHVWDPGNFPLGPEVGGVPLEPRSNPAIGKGSVQTFRGLNGPVRLEWRPAKLSATDPFPVGVFVGWAGAELLADEAELAKPTPAPIDVAGIRTLLATAQQGAQAADDALIAISGKLGA